MEQVNLINRIAESLGRPASYIDSSGYKREITAGAIDEQNRFAWVECRSKDNGGLVDIEFLLRITRDGELLRAWVLDSYNPYFGCDVQWMIWVGAHVVMIYQEKHEMMVASVPLEGDAKMVSINFPWEVRDDVVYFEGRGTELVEAISIPDLRPRIPLPTEWLKANIVPTREQNRLPDDIFRLQARFLYRFFGEHPPQPVADFLVGSLTSMYWDDFSEPADQYHEVRGRRGETPWLLPFFYYRQLHADEDANYLSLLDQLAAIPTVPLEPEWSPMQCACESAAAHVKERAKLLAQACRTNQLPDDTSCFFWYEHAMKQFAERLERYPDGFREIYATVAREHEWWKEWCEAERKRQWVEKSKQRNG
jgi:hypothetical protein